MARRHSGFGAELFIKDESDFKLIGGLRGDVALVDDSVDLFEVTGHDSPTTSEGIGRREHMGSLIDGAERTFEVFRNPEEDQQNLIRESIGQTKTFQVNHPAWDKPEQFDAVVMGWREVGELEGALVAEITLKQTGDQLPVVEGG